MKPLNLFRAACSAAVRLLRAPLATALLVCVFFMAPARSLLGATTVVGSVSGQWTTNNSPYLIGDVVEVASASDLVIDPGVTVILGPGASLEIRGSLTAIGSSDAPIRFRGATPEDYWNRVLVYYNSRPSTFAFCRFTDASTALYLYNYATSSQMATEVRNCEFDNCSEAGIRGYSRGYATWCGMTICVYNPQLNPVIANNRFTRCGNGVIMAVGGGRVSNGTGGYAYGRGRAYPAVHNNLFVDISGNAFESRLETYGTTSGGAFANNTVFGAQRGVLVNDPFNLVSYNNILAECAVGMEKTGSLGETLRYNCFFNNGENFVGFPSSYGNAILGNDNGDPCDFYFNIFQDPRFSDVVNLLPGPDSPCIDAGDPAIEDACAPPSAGSTVSDVGAYGGPDACAWPPLACDSPIITRQPRGRVVCAGATADLSVVGEGTGPLSYQWFGPTGQALEGGTESTLRFDAVELEDSGTYHVEVVNRCGSVVSHTVTLSVSEVCVSIDIYAGLRMDNLEPGRSYMIQATTDIGDSNSWQTLDQVRSDNPSLFWMDPQSARQGHRIYRVVPMP